MVPANVRARFPTSVVLRLRPLLGAGAALLVLVLAVFAASPAWHHALHRDGGSTTSEDCAIDLFAHGVALPVGASPVPPAVRSSGREKQAQAGEIDLPEPRYLRQPERGPPALG